MIFVIEILYVIFIQRNQWGAPRLQELGIHVSPERFDISIDTTKGNNSMTIEFTVWCYMEKWKY